MFLSEWDIIIARSPTRAVTGDKDLRQPEPPSFAVRVFFHKAVVAGIVEVARDCWKAVRGGRWSCLLPPAPLPS